jgi:hypothetical protein
VTPHGHNHALPRFNLLLLDSRACASLRAELEALLQLRVRNIRLPAVVQLECAPCKALVRARTEIERNRTRTWLTNDNWWAGIPRIL